MIPPSIQLELFPVNEDLGEGAVPFGKGNEQLALESRELVVRSSEQEILQESGEEAAEPDSVSQLTIDSLDAKRLTCQVREWLEPLYLTGLGERVRV